MLFELANGAGECRVTKAGLYWAIDARCAVPGPAAPRLYCDGCPLGPFLPEGDAWRLVTRVSNRTVPITPQSTFTLTPPDLLPDDPSQPLPQIENLPDLIPIQFNGKLYLKQAPSTKTEASSQTLK